MKYTLNDPPREFTPQQDCGVTICDVGEISLAFNEQVSFVSESGARYDFVRKNWGYYVTPSINGRLKTEGFKTAFVKNENGRLYIMAVEQTKMNLFIQYCETHGQKVLQWLDEQNNPNDKIQNA